MRVVGGMLRALRLSGLFDGKHAGPEPPILPMVIGLAVIIIGCIVIVRVFGKRNV